MKYNNLSLNISSDINYKSYKFEKYIFECIDNKKYIVGNNSEKNIKIESHIIEDICDETVGNDLLAEIIELRQRLPNFKLPYSNVVDEKNIEFVENLIDKKEINIIIKFCEKFGMPFIGDFTFKNYLGVVQLGVNEYKYFGFENDYNTRKSLNKCAFRIGTFIIGIDFIYKAFRLGLLLNKNEIIDNSNGDVAYSLDTICFPIEFLKQNTNNVSKMFADIMDSMDIYLKPIISTKIKIQTYKIYGTTLLSCALYQLLQFITSNNQNVKKCKMCHIDFIASRKDKEYCNGACRVKYFRYNKKTR